MKKAVIKTNTSKLYPLKSVAEFAAFGMWKNRKDMSDTETYIKQMREGVWGRYKK